MGLDLIDKYIFVRAVREAATTDDVGKEGL
jgi:hypothetical protein